MSTLQKQIVSLDGSTQLILEAIAPDNQKSNRATFLAIASHLRNNFVIIKKILSQRHEIGNHSEYIDFFPLLPAITKK